VSGLGFEVLVVPSVLMLLVLVVVLVVHVSQRINKVRRRSMNH